MSFWDKLTKKEKHDQDDYAPLFQVITSGAGGFVDVSALKNPDIFSAVTRISSAIASTPLKFDDASSDRGRKLLNLLNVSPNQDSNAQTFLDSIVIAMLLNGNSFATIDRRQDGTVTALHFLPNNRLTIKQDDKTLKLSYYLDDKTLIDTNNLLHFQINSNGFCGRTPLLALGKTKQIQQARDTTLRSFFETGFHGTGILKYQKSALSPDAREALKNQFERMNGGGSQTLLLDSTQDYTTIPVSDSVVNIANSLDFTTKQVASCFHIPANMVGIELAHSSTTELLTEFYQSLTSYYNAIISELNRKLGYGSHRFAFDIESLFTSDPQKKADLLATELQNSMITINEARQQLNLPPISGGDVLYKERSK